MADRSTLGEIVAALTTELIDFLDLDSNRVFLSAADDPPHFSADYDIVLQLGAETPGRAVVSGAGGRVVNQRTRKLTLLLRTRRVLDSTGTHTVHLLEATTGHLAREDAIHDVLEMWLPEAEERALLYEPARCGGWSRPKVEKQPEWLTSTLELDLPYLRDLDLERST